MPDIDTVLAGVGLAVSLGEIISKKITAYNQLQKHYAERLLSLRNEVRDNLEIVDDLLERDKSSKAVYDPYIRKSLRALRFHELRTAGNDFEPILGRHLRKAGNKTPAPKDSLRIFWNIHDTAAKLEDLNKRLKKIPAKPSTAAPRIMLTRRLPALQKRLAEIDNALKIIPVKKNGI